MPVQKRPASRSGRSNWPVRKRPAEHQEPALVRTASPTRPALQAVKQEPADTPRTFISVSTQTRVNIVTIHKAVPGTRMAEDRACAPRSLAIAVHVGWRYRLSCSTYTEVGRDTCGACVHVQDCERYCGPDQAIDDGYRLSARQVYDSGTVKYM